MTPLADQSTGRSHRIPEIAPTLETGELESRRGDILGGGAPAGGQWRAAKADKTDDAAVSSRRSSSRRFVFAVLLAATLAGVIFYCRLYVLVSSRGVPVPRPTRLLLFEMLNWYLWVPLAPLALWLVRRRVQWLMIGIASIGGWLTHLIATIAVRSIIAAIFFNNRDAITGDRLATQLRNGLTFDSIPSLLTFLALVCAAYAWHHNERSIQLEAQLAGAELQALRAQLQPHFLFNTLNSISVLIEDNPRGANQMLLHLSDILRVMMHRTGTPEVSLREELELIRNYLEIEQVRFRDRLTVRFESDPEALEARVPSLLLQPLVENAVRHGIAQRSTPGLIEITSERNNGSVRITVRDNGGGIRTGSSTINGVGLRNTRARLKLLYRDKHQFLLQNVDGGGLEALIEIPYRS